MSETCEVPLLFYDCTKWGYQHDISMYYIARICTTNSQVKINQQDN